MKEARQFEAALLRGGPSGGASPDDRQDGQWPKQDSDPMQSPISCAGAHDAIVIPNQATAKFESGHQGPKQASTQVKEAANSGGLETFIRIGFLIVVPDHPA